jgi:hypothetical protein
MEKRMQVQIGSKKRRIGTTPIEKKSKLAKLKKRSVIKDDPDSIVHMDWLKSKS